MIKNCSSFQEMKRCFEENADIVQEIDEIHIAEEGFTDLTYKLYAPNSITFSNKTYYRLAKYQKWLTVYFDRKADKILKMEYGMIGSKWKEHSWAKTVSS